MLRERKKRILKLRLRSWWEKRNSTKNSKSKKKWRILRLRSLKLWEKRKVKKRLRSLNRLRFYLVRKCTDVVICVMELQERLCALLASRMIALFILALLINFLWKIIFVVSAILVSFRMSLLCNWHAGTFSMPIVWRNYWNISGAPSGSLLSSWHAQPASIPLSSFLTVSLFNSRLKRLMY